MKTADLQLGFLSPLDISSRAFGAILLRYLQETLPRAMPMRYGNFEPLRNRFEDGGMERLLEYWAHPLLWTARRPRVDGDFRFGSERRHASHHLSLCSADWNIDVCLSYFRGMSQMLEVDFSYLHVFGEQELSLRERYSRIFPFRRGLLTTDLARGLPDLPAVVVLGPPYLRLINRRVLSACLADSVEDIGQDRVELRVVGDPRQLLVRFSEFDDRRSDVKKRLGESIFMSNSGDEAKSVPDFSFR